MIHKYCIANCHDIVLFLQSDEVKTELRYRFGTHSVRRNRITDPPCVTVNQVMQQSLGIPHTHFIIISKNFLTFDIKLACELWLIFNFNNWFNLLFLWKEILLSLNSEWFQIYWNGTVYHYCVREYNPEKDIFVRLI